MSGMLSVGAVLMLLMRSSLASGGKSAAAGGDRVRGSGAQWKGALTRIKKNVREPTNY